MCDVSTLLWWVGTSNNKLHHEAENNQREIKSCFLLLMTQAQQFVVFAVMLGSCYGPLDLSQPQRMMYWRREI